MMAEEKTNTEKLEMLNDIMRDFHNAKTADDEDRSRALDDMRFLDGDQWPAEIRQTREEKGRPCLTINRLPGFVDQVTGDQRQNKPSIKVRPVDSVSDPKTAELYTGLIRNIENASDASIAYDTAAECAASCGRGFFRIITEYTDDCFDQVISIKRILNPFSVVWDQSAQEYDLSDAAWISVSEWISKKEYETKWPDAAVSSFDSADDYAVDWSSGEMVRVSEIFRKKRVKKTIYLLNDGRVVDAVPDDLPPWIEVERQREAETHEIEWIKVSGAEVLEGPIKWPGKYIPIVPVWGKEIVVDGKRITRGVIRYAKEPQQMYNYWRSMATEGVAQTPKNPYIVTPKQIAGYEPIWDKANESNRPYLPFNPDPQLPNGGKPYKEQPATVQTGMIQEMSVAADDMKATTGIYDASLGNRSNESSGRAIIARQREGDTATFAYSDNMIRSISYGGKILVDLIPKTYDASRIVRVIGVDGTEKFEKVNWPSRSSDGKIVYLNDLSLGRFDVAVTAGPSYATQRIEAADSMIQFIKALPAAAAVIPDLIAKNMDWPGADEIEERFKLLLPPQVQALIKAKENGGEAVPQQPQQPNPMDVIAVKRAEMEAKGAEAKARGELAKAHGQELKNQISFAELENLIGAQAAPQITADGTQPTGGYPGTLPDEGGTYYE